MATMTRRQTIIVLSGIIALLLCCLALVRAFTGGQLGEACGPTGACSFGLTCVNTRCLPRCRDDGDCPATMQCGILTVESSQFGESTGPMLVCLETADAERQVQRSVAIEDSKVLALQRKRSETYEAVQKLLATEKWVLSDEKFESAWNRLPEGVRRARPADVLADLIMTTAGTPVR